MEIINDGGKNAEHEEAMKNWETSHRRGKVFGGLIVMSIGALFLARELGAEIPHWLFTWKMLLIVVGLYVGFKHQFRSPGFLIPILIGTAFLVQDFFPDFRISHLLWPIILIIAGVAMIFKPHRRNRWRNHNWRHHKHQQWRQKHQQWQEWKENYNPDKGEDYLQVDVVFGSVKKNIISKNFTGGEVNAVFGGAEINLMHAEINGRVVLELNQVFGGTKLIVPPHWEIKSELTTVLGSVEDKRPVMPKLGTDNNNVLVLKGAAVFGGIDIKSY